MVERINKNVSHVGVIVSSDFRLEILTICTQGNYFVGRDISSLACSQIRFSRGGTDESIFATVTYSVREVTSHVL